jgi:hypothetical protein
MANKLTTQLEQATRAQQHWSHFVGCRQRQGRQGNDRRKKKDLKRTNLLLGVLWALPPSMRRRRKLR